jgi:GT2 family glycosyltransferase
MTVYIGIVTYNSVDDLPACFEALRAQTYPGLSVVVLDNASSDGSADWVDAHQPHARLLRGDANLGYGRGHNRILKSIDLQPGDYYLSLNPDAVLTPDYIATIVRTLETKPQSGWAIGKLLLSTDDAEGVQRIYSAGHALLRSGFAFNIGHGLPDGEAYGHSREVFGAPGAAAIYKAELITAISENGNFFDPVMFLYAEDTDVDWRAQRRGWRCWYVPQAVAFHRGSSPSGALKSMAIANRYLSVIKNAMLADLILFNLPYMVAHCLARLLVTPSFGWTLIRQIARYAIPTLRRRSRMRSVADLRQWYRWAAEQPSTQRSGFARLLRRIRADD